MSRAAPRPSVRCSVEAITAAFRIRLWTSRDSSSRRSGRRAWTSSSTAGPAIPVVRSPRDVPGDGGAQRGRRPTRCARRPDAVGLIPTGALEQHGPHLPLGTDFMVAEALARAVAEKLPVHGGRHADAASRPLRSPPGASRGPSASRRTRSAAGSKRTSPASSGSGSSESPCFSGHGGNFAFIGELAAEHTSRPGPTRVIAYDDLLGFVRVMDEAARTCGLEAPATDAACRSARDERRLALFDVLVA